MTTPQAVSKIGTVGIIALCAGILLIGGTMVYDISDYDNPSPTRRKTMEWGYGISIGLLVSGWIAVHVGATSKIPTTFKTNLQTT